MCYAIANTFPTSSKGVSDLDTPGGKQKVIVVNEPELSCLIFFGCKPEARKFQRWGYHEVLPSSTQKLLLTVNELSPT